MWILHQMSLGSQFAAGRDHLSAHCCSEQHLLDAIWNKTHKDQKCVISIHFHIILISFHLYSNLQKQNTSAFIKRYSHSIHWLFSMGFLSVSSIRPIKTKTDDNSYKNGSGQGFFSWRGFGKRSHAAEHIISLPFFPKKRHQFNWTPQTPEKVFLQ